MLGVGLKNWIGRARGGNVRMQGLFWLSVAECTLVPVPLEAVLFPVMQLNRDRVWRIAFWVTMGALLGALLFYGLAYVAMETLGVALVSWAGWEASLADFNALFDRYGFWAIVAAGILPIPLQVAMIAAGAAGYTLGLYVLAILLSRSLRYFGVAWLVLRYGDGAQRYLRANRLRFVGWTLCLVGLLWAVSFMLLHWISP